MAKIVLIDYEEQDWRPYAEALQKAGFAVFTAQESKSGLALVQREKPDLVLLEILLPKVDGYEVLRQIRRNPATADIRVVLLTHLGHDEDIKVHASLGAHEHWVKAQHPPAQLVVKVKALLKTPLATSK